MIRKIIQIDEEKCTGCGICAAACHEGAIGMVNGKAKLLREDFCDGLGDCLPACPVGAITSTQREAPAYDEAAVRKSMAAKAAPHGCPGAALHRFTPAAPAASGNDGASPSQLAQWPCQIRLISPVAPCFAGAHLLIAADCTAYAYADFHRDFMQGRVTLIGCPKLDAFDYAEKLTAILSANDVKSVTLLRMEVPCCGGMERAARLAIANSGRSLPLRVVTVKTNGTLT